MFTFPTNFMALANSFVPPYDPYYNNVEIYLPGEPVNPLNYATVKDYSKNNKPVTHSSTVALTAASSKYGSTSIDCSGSKKINYIQCSNLTNTFTLEGWFYFIGDDGFGQDDTQTLVDSRLTTSTGYIWSNNYGGSFRMQNVEYNAYLYTSPPPSLQTWRHLALVRNNNNFKFFRDGILTEAGSIPVSVNTPTRGSIAIGGNVLTGADKSDFLLDSFRITIGVARYTANFNPETETYLAY